MAAAWVGAAAALAMMAGVVLAARTSPSSTTPMTPDLDQYPFPMEALFKPVNASRVSDMHRPSAELDLGDVGSEELDPFAGDDNKYADYGPCAVALVRALPSGPRGRALSVAVFIASMAVARGAVRKAMAVVIQGLFLAKNLPLLDRRAVRATPGHPDGPFEIRWDWASLFEGVDGLP